MYDICDAHFTDFDSFVIKFKMVLLIGCVRVQLIYILQEIY